MGFKFVLFLVHLIGLYKNIMRLFSGIDRDAVYNQRLSFSPNRDLTNTHNGIAGIYSYTDIFMLFFNGFC